MRLSSMLNDVKHFSARHKNFRFLFTCRPEVIALIKLKDVLPSIVECNLQSPELSLSLNERQKIFDLYIHDEFNVNQDNDFLLLTEQLPLLCTLYRKHFCSSIQDFILNSDEMITSKIEEMRESENPSYICLALLLVAGELDTQFCFSEYVYHEGTYDTLQSVISESSFKKKPTASRKLLLSGFDAIEGIYTNREGYLLSFTNDKIYDVVVSCIGSKFIHSIVKFAKLLQEIRHRNERVFANIHNNNQGYRKAFIEYLKVHLTESDIDSLKLPLFLSCKLGYDDFVLHLVGQWTRLLDYSMYKTPLCEDSSMYSMYQNETPLSEACSMGYFDIVKFLVDSQKNIDVKRIEPIELACKNGHLHIVKFLLKKGVYRDLTNTLIESCKNGFTDIVLLLTQKEPNLLEQFQLHSGASNVLITACTNGHEEVVRILLEHNLPVNNPEFHTPLYYASMKGHLNIVILLLNSKAQVNKCDISVAEWNDHEEIVTCLRNHLSLKNE
ncbi:unnamed protein product [Mytilus edulis]|uniref:Uncharacterized protein n=1 Tax=Mytilus edulis TaxID=6550 RepID=A0A8S3PZR2_MYTED|nr:unnamed protein product [Mytilus edulis]